MELKQTVTQIKFLQVILTQYCYTDPSVCPKLSVV